MELAAGWGLSCHCPRCADPTEFGTNISALQCSHCREGLILPQSPTTGAVWSCRFCSNPFEVGDVVRILSRCQTELQIILDSDPTVPM